MITVANKIPMIDTASQISSECFLSLEIHLHRHQETNISNHLDIFMSPKPYCQHYNEKQNIHHRNKKLPSLDEYWEHEI